MKKCLPLLLIIFFLSALDLHSFLFNYGYKNSEYKANLILLKSCSNDIEQANIFSAIEKFPALRLNIVSYSAVKPSKGMIDLIRNRKVEPVLRLILEPEFALFYSTKAVPGGLSSFPEDASLIVFKNQEEFRENFGIRSTVLYMDSTNFSKESLGDLKRAGVNELLLANSVANRGIYSDSEFIIYIVNKLNASNVDTALELLQNRTGDDDLLVFELDESLINDYEGLQKLNDAIVRSGSNCRLISEVNEQARMMGLSIGEMSDETDKTFFDNNPWIFKKLYQARKAVEDYKNSGQAKIKTLELLKDYIYGLYDYRFLRELAGGSVPRQEFFTARLNDIAALTNRNIFAEHYTLLESTSDAADLLEFTEVSNSSFTINNIFARNPLIKNFSLVMNNSASVFTVQVDSSVFLQDKVLDIYIDLNNKRAAGSVNFLDSSANTFKAEDGWEFVLRFENKYASLMRPGRSDPVLVQKFKTTGVYRAEIPKSVLKGSMLKWGYQVVLSEKKKGQPVSVLDFIRTEDLNISTPGRIDRLPLIRCETK